MFIRRDLKFFPTLIKWYTIRLPLRTRTYVPPDSYRDREDSGFNYSNHLNIKTDTLWLRKLNVTPLHDRVIVKPAAAEEKTAGGIIIPDTAKEKPQRGTVIAAGPGKKDEPVTVKAGDTVLYGKYAGTEIQIEGDDYLIMRESRYPGDSISYKLLAVSQLARTLKAHCQSSKSNFKITN